MASSTISESEVISRLLNVFRTYGYDGATMSRLSQAVGLEKASLYHRYPKGKEQMVLAVAASVCTWFDEHVFRVLKQDLPPLQLVEAVSIELQNLYEDGTKSCVLDMLSIPSGGVELEATIRGATEGWIEAFQGVSERSGFDSAEARNRAEDAIIRIEGSLVVSRARGDSMAFRRTIDELPRILLKGSG